MGPLIGEISKGYKGTRTTCGRVCPEHIQIVVPMDYRQKISIFRNAADLLCKRKFDIAAMLSYENGKSRYESIGEVDEAIDFMSYMPMRSK